MPGFCCGAGSAVAGLGLGIPEDDADDVGGAAGAPDPLRGAAEGAARGGTGGAHTGSSDPWASWRS